MLTQLGCPPTSCECEPPFLVDTLPDATVGRAYSAEVKVGGTKPFEHKNIYVSAGLLVSATGDALLVSGTPTEPPTLVIELLNDCADCTVVTLRSALLDPCVAIEHDPMPPLRVATTTTVGVRGSDITLVPITAPAGAAIAVESGYITLFSEKAGAFKFKLKNRCSEVEVNGEFKADAVVVCVPPSFKTSTGSSVFNEGEAVNYTIFLNGTGPMEVVNAPEDLQAGLTYQLSEVDGQWQISVTGTPIKKPCDDPGKKECKAYCWEVKNPCGKARVCQTLSYEGSSTLPKPIFCVGLVDIKEVNGGNPAGTRCFLVTATFFLPETKLKIYFASSGGLNETSEQWVEVDELDIGTDGNAQKKVCVVASGSGCLRGHLYARHETCGVVSKATALTSTLALLNDCFDRGGGG